MRWFVKKKSDDYADVPEERDSETEFKPFHETYKIITFAMCIGMIYPNSDRFKFRVLFIFIYLLSVTPPAGMIVIDAVKSFLRKDVIEVIRHSTIIGPFMGGFLKMFLMLHKHEASHEIIAEINRDHALYNTATEDNKAVIRASIQNSLVYSEKCWAATVVVCAMTFPFMAIIQTLYSYLLNYEAQKYMIHDLKSPFSENPEDRFESPFFEIMFVYMFYCAVFYVINFSGYDGFFGLCMNHACLKITLYCKALDDAVRGPSEELETRVAEVIREQNRTYKYIEHIQDTFNLWLGIIFLATMIQLCNLLYHISEGYGLDLRYAVFISGCVVHIYLPCRYAAKLKAMSLEIGSRFYCSGWEGVHSRKTWKTLVFMIKRSQSPILITAVGMLIFDMELFVSILQTSYSMYTLLSSKK